MARTSSRIGRYGKTYTKHAANKIKHLSEPFERDVSKKTFPKSLDMERKRHRNDAACLYILVVLSSAHLSARNIAMLVQTSEEK